jgi:hypothetical protein
MMDGITGTQANIVGKVTMIYKQYSKLINEMKDDIKDMLNLTCTICNKAYVTTFELVKYCSDCIDRLEREVENGEV